MDKLEEYNGSVYITSSWPHSDRPEVTKAWYPVSNGYGARLEAHHIDQEHFGKTVEYDVNGLHYIWLNRSYSSRLDVPLLNGGATVPDHTETTAVPCPKVRKGLPTRWRSGRWQKYLKSQGGWQPA